MEIISQVAEAMQEILTEKSDAMGRETGFIVRERKLSGSGYAQTLVFGWLSDPESTLEDLSQMAKSLGIEISSQGLDKRFSRESSEFMEQLLSLGIEQMIISDAVACSLMQRFNGVYIHDSSTIILPDELKEIWRGCGGSSCENTSSSVKIQLQLELTKGRLIGPELQDGREQDKSCSLYKEPLPRGSLCIRDLGYFSIENLKELDSKKVYWLSRMKSQVKIYWEGKCCSLADFLKDRVGDEIDIQLLIGVKEQLPCRLLAFPVPEKVANERRRRIKKEAKRKGKMPTKNILYLAGFTILATNAPVELLNLNESLVLMRARWQIEVLFKLWKKYGCIDKSRSEKPWRILTEVYSKLIAMIIQHWIFLTSCWKYSDRSLMKASKTVRKQVVLIAIAFALGSIDRLIEAIETIQRCLAKGCRINKRKTNPHTYQLLDGALSFP